jgi:teichoic acid transport system permease protein
MTGSVKLIINNRDLVTKVYLPKYILLFSKSLTYLFKFGISLCLAFILMLVQGVPFSWTILLMIPIIIVLYIICVCSALERVKSLLRTVYIRRRLPI